MKNRLLISGCTLLAAGLLLFTTAYGQQNPEDAAKKSAAAWIALVDAGQYGQSWDQASQIFKSKVKEGQWVAMVKQAREPLGKLKSRSFEDFRHLKNPPNAPEGDYIVMQYSAAFAKAPSATETVSLIQEKDGGWRVAGYWIKPG
ncbi:MAG TPA: DUF4019 domain-containing protein [Terriglobia bacterium]|nr:DUF4019 domain-containing protein [Terriglobia bacterium]